MTFDDERPRWRDTRQGFSLSAIWFCGAILPCVFVHLPASGALVALTGAVIQGWICWILLHRKLPASRKMSIRLGMSYGVLAAFCMPFIGLVFGPYGMMAGLFLLLPYVVVGLMCGAWTGTAWWSEFGEEIYRHNPNL